jgi:hypothetical protein
MLLPLGYVKALSGKSIGKSWTKHKSCGRRKTDPGEKSGRRDLFFMKG